MNRFSALFIFIILIISCQPPTGDSPTPTPAPAPAPDPSPTPVGIAITGAMDLSYGNSSKGYTLVPEEGTAYAWTPRDVLLLSNGSICVTGSVSNGMVTALKFNNTGASETSFGNLGQFDSNQGGMGNGEESCMDSLGRILVVGSNASGGTGYEGWVMRINANGTLDSTFDSDGVVWPTAAGSIGGNAYGTAVAVDGSNNVIVGAETDDNRFYIYRVLASDGSLDTSFDTDGIAEIDTGSDTGPLVMKVLSNGKILIAGWAVTTNRDAMIMRLNADGSFDATFSGDGILTIPVGGGDDMVYDIVVLPNDKILLGGTADVAGSGNFFALQVNSNGTLDTSFGTGGTVILDINSSNNRCYDIELLDNGRFALGGFAGNGTDNDMAAAVFSADGVLDTTFGSNGYFLVDIDDPSRITSGIGNDNPGRGMAYDAVNGRLYISAPYATRTPGNGGGRFMIARIK